MEEEVSAAGTAAVAAVDADETAAAAGGADAGEG